MTSKDVIPPCYGPAFGLWLYRSSNAEALPISIQLSPNASCRICSCETPVRLASGTVDKAGSFETIIPESMLLNTAYFPVELESMYSGAFWYPNNMVCALQ